MKLVFHSSKTAALYFCLEQLAAWHFSARSYFKTYLLSLEPKLLEESVQNALREFSALRKNFPDARSVFEVAFYTTSDPFSFLASKLSHGDFAQLQRIWSTVIAFLEPIFISHFAPILESAEKEMTAWSENNTPLLQSALEELTILYGAPLSTLEAPVQVILLPTAPGYSGGGSNIDHQTISLEVFEPRQASDCKRFIAVLLHEFIHLRLEEVHVFPLLEKADLLESDANEWLARLLYPSGYLGHKRLELPITPQLQSRFGENLPELFQAIEGFIRTKQPVSNLSVIFDKIATL